MQWYAMGCMKKLGWKTFSNKIEVFLRHLGIVFMFYGSEGGGVYNGFTPVSFGQESQFCPRRGGYYPLDNIQLFRFYKQRSLY